MSDPANLDQQEGGGGGATAGLGLAVDVQVPSTSHQASTAPTDSPGTAQSDLSAYGSQLFVAETNIVSIEHVADHLVPAVGISGDMLQMSKVAEAASAAASGNSTSERAKLDAALPQARPTIRSPEVPPIRTPSQLKSIERDPTVIASVSPASQKAPGSSETADGANRRAAWLVSCGGDGIPRGTVLSFYFSPGQKFVYSIGIDRSCDIVLTSQGISREHAIFGFDPVTTQFFITDRESTNGTFIHRVEQKLEQVRGQVYLSDGCRIRLGRQPLDFLFRCF